MKKPAGIAQLVEQRTENPRVTSSSLVPGIHSPQGFQPLATPRVALVTRGVAFWLKRFPVKGLRIS